MTVHETAMGEFQTPDATQVGLPPLENGDRLTRREFERRYQARPDIKKAELIEGVVYVPSPVRFRSHGEPHSHIITWLGIYCAATPGVRLGDNATVRLDRDNEVQPDALLRVEPEAGGHSRISEDDYVEGAPEFIVEIAATSASYDLHDKLQVYRRNGVQEYVVWRVYDRRLDWFYLAEDVYVPLDPSTSWCCLQSDISWLMVGRPSAPRGKFGRSLRRGTKRSTDG